MGSLRSLGGDALVPAADPVDDQRAVLVWCLNLEQWRRLLVAFDRRAGCAVVAVAVSASDPSLREHAGAVFEEWDALLAELLVDGGIDAHSAPGLAMLIMAAIEGAVAISRAEDDMEPFETVATQLLELIAERTTR